MPEKSKKVIRLKTARPNRIENDLKNFLNPTDGKLSVFFNEDLKKYLKIERAMESQGFERRQVSDEFVAYLNNAFRFAKSAFRERIRRRNSSMSFN
jgi:hypothetical protein